MWHINYIFKSKICFICILFTVFYSCSSSERIKKNNEPDLESRKNIVSIKSFDDIDKSKVNKINGKQISEELKKDSLAVIYFANYCSSKTCTNDTKLVEDLEHYFTKRGYKYYLVLRDPELVDVILYDNKLQGPVFAIDNDYYSGMKGKNYLKFFVNDLLGLDLNEKFYKNIAPIALFFVKGKLACQPFVYEDKDIQKSYCELIDRVENVNNLKK